MRKIIKVFAIILLLSLTVFTTVSCGKKDKNTVDWSYSKKDASKFVELDGEIAQSEKDLTFTLTYKDAIFKDNIDKSHILLFDFSNIENVKDYIKYEDVLNFLVDYSSLRVDDSKNKIEITFNGNPEDTYGVIIHKDSLTIDDFASGFASGPQYLNKVVITDYEENLIKTKGGWDVANKMLTLASHISQVVLGFATNTPNSYAAGIFGIAQTLGISFFGKQTSIDAVSKQLEVVDHKIDMLTAQIDSNQKQIIDEFVRTQAMIDEVKVNQYNQNITAFQTDYVKPLDDYIFIYKDTVEQAYKSYISESKSVTVHYKNNTNYTDLVFESEGSLENTEAFTVNIEKFTNAMSYLSEHNNTVGDGFANALLKDIESNVNNVVTTTGRSADKVSEDVYKALTNDVNQLVLSKEDDTLHRDVLNFISNFISYAKALAGVNFESVINSYISRLEYIYNYTSETKPLVRDLLASLKLSLDYYVCIAQTACIAQKINYTEEIAAAYNLACDYIEIIYDAQMARNDRYSFLTKCVTDGALYQAKCDVSFSDLGNNPTFHSKFNLVDISSYDGGDVHGVNVDVNTLNMVDYSMVRAIAKRFELLKAIGAVKNDTFIKYLNGIKVISSEDMDILNRLFNSGRTTESVGKILTSYAIRDLTNSDSLKFTCVCYGNEDGYYFVIRHEYSYRYKDSNVEPDYWSGKIAYGDIVYGEDGSLDENKTISAYAKYSESHWYWTDDEHWGFIDDIFGNFFYILNKE